MPPWVCPHIIGSGTGGLIEDITHRKLPVRFAYLLILLATVALTCKMNVNAIIAYAKRAFALYYFMQCSVAFLVDREVKGRRSGQLAGFALLALICPAVFLFGLPSE